jgi:hypothetical protein
VHLDFGDVGAKRYVEWSIVVPTWLVDGYQWYATFYWTANSTSTNSVRWGMQCKNYQDAHNLDAAWGATAEVTDANTATAYQLHISSSVAVPFTGGPTQGDFVQIRAYRDSGSPDDTLGVTASLLMVYLQADAV